MATVRAVSTGVFTTTAGAKSDTIAAVPDDLLVAVTAHDGQTGSHVVTDDQGGTWDQIIAGLSSTSVDSVAIWIRRTRVVTSATYTVTTTPASSTGGGLQVFAISGMTRAGLAAVRSSGKQDNQTAATTPAPVLSLTPLSTSVIITGLIDGTNGSANQNPRAGYTERFDAGHNVPATGFATSTLDSGETSATLTFGGTTPSIYGDVAVELDSTDPVGARRTPTFPHGPRRRPKFGPPVLLRQSFPDYTAPPFVEAVEVFIAADVMAQGGWYVTQLDSDSAEADGYWAQLDATTTLDVTAAFFPPAAPVDQPVDEIGNRWFVVSSINVSEAGARAPPGYVDETGRRVFLTSPEAPPAAITDAELQAAGQLFEHPGHPEEEPLYDTPPDGAVEAFLAGPPAAVEPDETFAAQPHYGDIQIDPEDHVDTPLPDQLEAFLFPPDVTVEFFADPLKEQPWFGDQEIDTELANESTLENVAPFFPPDVTEPFFAQYPLAEQPWFADQDIDTELQNDSTLDVTPAFFQPDVTDDFQAALYPLAEQPWFPGEETEDYANDSTLENVAAFYPPDVTTDFLATQPLAEQPWFEAPDIDTELANESSLDVTPAFFPPSAVDDSYAAALDLNQDPDFTEPDWEYSPFLDQIEGYLSPNDAFDTTIATQPLAEQPWFPDQDIDTELANDTTLEVHAALFPPDVTTDFLATQPLAEQPWYPDQETEDYQNDSTVDTSWSLDFASGDETTAITQPLPEFPEYPDDLSQYDTSYLEQNEGFIAGPPTFAPDAEALAATQVFEQDIAVNFPDPDPTNDQPLVDGAVEAFQSPNDAFDVTIAAQYALAEQPWFPGEETEDYANDSSLDVTAQIFPPPADESILAAQFMGENPEDVPELIQDAWTDDPAAFLSLATDDGYIAAQDVLPQPFDEEPWFDFQPSGDDGTTAYLAGDDGYIAALDLPDQWADALDETPEQPQTPLEVEWLDTLALTDGMVAAVHHLGVEVDAHFIPDPEIDPQLSTLEVTAAFLPPPPPSGIGPDFFVAILRPRWRTDFSLRWTASSGKRWKVAGLVNRWRAKLRSRF